LNMINDRLLTGSIVHVLFLYGQLGKTKESPFFIVSF
jgi:hypothetical protein